MAGAVSRRGLGQARSFLRSAIPTPVSSNPASRVAVTANPVIGRVGPVDWAAFVFGVVVVDVGVVAGVVVVEVGVVVGVVVVEVGVVAGVVVVDVGVLAGVVVEAVFAMTTIVPCMNGWIEQM